MTSYHLSLLGTNLRNSDNFGIYVPLQLQYAFLLFRMSYKRKCNETSKLRLAINFFRHSYTFQHKVVIEEFA